KSIRTYKPVYFQKRKFCTSVTYLLKSSIIFINRQGKHENQMHKKESIEMEQVNNSSQNLDIIYNLRSQDPVLDHQGAEETRGCCHSFYNNCLVEFIIWLFQKIKISLQFLNVIFLVPLPIIYF